MWHFHTGYIMWIDLDLLYSIRDTSYQYLDYFSFRFYQVVQGDFIFEWICDISLFDQIYSGMCPLVRIWILETLASSQIVRFKLQVKLSISLMEAVILQ